MKLVSINDDIDQHIINDDTIAGIILQYPNTEGKINQQLPTIIENAHRNKVKFAYL